MNEYFEIFFNSFNLAMRAAYDACMKIAEERAVDVFAKNSKDLGACVDKEYEKWLSETLQGIGKTPLEYLDGTGFDEITEMFFYGAEICDDDLPEIFVNKLLSFGDKALDFLTETLVSSITDTNVDKIIPSVTAARLLGRYQNKKAVLPLINVLESSQGISELMQETARDALVNIGKAAADLILQEMSTGKRSAAACEYLAMSLAEIGKDCRSDEIYSALKNAFHELPDKAIAASCLAKYGDGRAIPALRGYLLRNGENLGRETFYDIVAAVRQLGGKIDDLKQVPKM